MSRSSVRVRSPAPRGPSGDHLPWASMLCASVGRCLLASPSAVTVITPRRARISNNGWNTGEGWWTYERRTSSRGAGATPLRHGARPRRASPGPRQGLRQPPRRRRPDALPPLRPTARRVHAPDPRPLEAAPLAAPAPACPGFPPPTAGSLAAGAFLYDWGASLARTQRDKAIETATTPRTTPSETPTGMCTRSTTSILTPMNISTRARPLLRYRNE